MSRPTPLAVTGVGAVTALGEGRSCLLAALDAGRHGFTEAPADGLPEHPRWAGRVTAFDPKPYIAPMRARRLDRASLFAVAAARRALSSAALEEAPELAHELGIVVGTSSAGSGPLTTFLDVLFRRSPDEAPPFEFPNTVANAPASHVSIELGLKGPNTTLSHSEAVVGSALLQGRLMLTDRRCSALLLGAVDEWSPYYQLGYSQLGVVRSQPRGGGGILLAEGAALMVLEEEERAAARRAPVLARVLGVAVGSAAGEPYRWLPDAAVLERVIREALEQAGEEAAAVGSVVLAANGVAAMEEAEAEALSRVFAGRRLAATGLKGAVGERALSGSLSVAVAALARHRRRLPPYAGGALARWPEAIQPLTSPAPLPPGPTLVVLYGFGGNYAAVVMA